MTGTIIIERGNHLGKTVLILPVRAVPVPGFVKSYLSQAVDCIACRRKKEQCNSEGGALPTIKPMKQPAIRAMVVSGRNPRKAG
jgi:hypothetical protein